MAAYHAFMRALPSAGDIEVLPSLEKIQAIAAEAHARLRLDRSIMRSQLEAAFLDSQQHIVTAWVFHEHSLVSFGHYLDRAMQWRSNCESKLSYPPPAKLPAKPISTHRRPVQELQQLCISASCALQRVFHSILTFIIAHCRQVDATSRPCQTLLHELCACCDIALANSLLSVAHPMGASAVTPPPPPPNYSEYMCAQANDIFNRVLQNIMHCTLAMNDGASGDKLGSRQIWTLLGKFEKVIPPNDLFKRAEKAILACVRAKKLRDCTAQQALLLRHLHANHPGLAEKIVVRRQSLLSRFMTSLHDSP